MNNPEKESFFKKDLPPLDAKITKIEPSQIGVKIEFSNGFYTDASVEQEKDGSITMDNGTYKVGDEVKLTLYREDEDGKTVHGFEKS